VLFRSVLICEQEFSDNMNSELRARSKNTEIESQKQQLAGKLFAEKSSKFRQTQETSKPTCSLSFNAHTVSRPLKNIEDKLNVYIAKIAKTQ